MFYDCNLPRWQAPLLFQQLLKGKHHNAALAAYMIDRKAPVADWPKLKVFFPSDSEFLTQARIQQEQDYFQETGILSTYELAGFSRPPKGTSQDVISVSFLWTEEVDTHREEFKAPARLMLTGLLSSLKNIKGIYLLEIQAFTRLASEQSQSRYQRQRLSFTATPDMVAGIQHLERVASLKQQSLADFQSHRPYRFYIDSPRFWHNDKGYLESRGKVLNAFRVPDSPFHEHLNVTKSWYELYDDTEVNVEIKGGFPKTAPVGYAQSMIERETLRV